MKNIQLSTALWVLLAATLGSINACSSMTTSEYSVYIFKRQMDESIGCPFVNTFLNNRFIERKQIVEGKAEYILNGRPQSSCVIGFIVDEKAQTSTCARPLTEAVKLYYLHRGLDNGQPPWKGDVTGAIVSWRYISAPTACRADFSGH